MCETNENKWKEAGVGPFKKELVTILIIKPSFVICVKYNLKCTSLKAI